MGRPVAPAMAPVTRDRPRPLDRHAAMVEWRSFTAPMIVGGVQPLDVRQGALADCNVAAGLASIAKYRPELIADMLELHPPKRRGDRRKIGLKLYPAGPQSNRIEWKVDDDLPVNHLGLPLYGRWTVKTQPELWFPIIEKAYTEWQSTLMGLDGPSYDAIDDGGDAAELFSTLLGATVSNHEVATSSRAELRTALKQAHDARWPAIAFTHEKDQAALYFGTGLEPWHSYAVLGVHGDDGANGPCTVTLYNPWGHKEFGDDGVDDGQFDMPLDAFRKYFRNVNIACDVAEPVVGHA